MERGHWRISGGTRIVEQDDCCLLAVQITCSVVASSIIYTAPGMVSFPLASSAAQRIYI